MSLSEENVDMTPTQVSPSALREEEHIYVTMKFSDEKQNSTNYGPNSTVGKQVEKFENMLRQYNNYIEKYQANKYGTVRPPPRHRRRHRNIENCFPSETKTNAKSWNMYTLFQQETEDETLPRSVSLHCIGNSNDINREDFSYLVLKPPRKKKNRRMVIPTLTSIENDMCHSENEFQCNDKCTPLRPNRKTLNCKSLNNLIKPISFPNEDMDYNQSVTVKPLSVSLNNAQESSSKEPNHDRTQDNAIEEETDIMPASIPEICPRRKTILRNATSLDECSHFPVQREKQRTGLSDHVRFSGQTLPATYSRATNFLDPTEHHQPKNIKIMEKANSIAALTEHEHERPSFLNVRQRLIRSNKVATLKKRINKAFKRQKNVPSCWAVLLRKKNVNQFGRSSFSKHSVIVTSKSHESFASIFTSSDEGSISALPDSWREKALGEDLFTIDIKDSVEFPEHISKTDPMVTKPKRQSLRKRLLSLSKDSTASLDAHALKKAYSFIENNILSSRKNSCSGSDVKSSFPNEQNLKETPSTSRTSRLNSTDSGIEDSEKIKMKSRFFIRSTSIPDLAPRILKAFSKPNLGRKHSVDSNAIRHDIPRRWGNEGKISVRSPSLISDSIKEHIEEDAVTIGTQIVDEIKTEDKENINRTNSATTTNLLVNKSNLKESMTASADAHEMFKNETPVIVMIHHNYQEPENEEKHIPNENGTVCGSSEYSKDQLSIDSKAKKEIEKLQSIAHSETAPLSLKIKKTKIKSILLEDSVVTEIRTKNVTTSDVENTFENGSSLCTESTIHTFHIPVEYQTSVEHNMGCHSKEINDIISYTNLDAKNPPSNESLPEVIELEMYSENQKLYTASKSKIETVEKLIRNEKGLLNTCTVSQDVEKKDNKHDLQSHQNSDIEMSIKNESIKNSFMMDDFWSSINDTLCGNTDDCPTIPIITVNSETLSEGNDHADRLHDDIAREWELNNLHKYHESNHKYRFSSSLLKINDRRRISANSIPECDVELDEVELQNMNESQLAFRKQILEGVLKNAGDVSNDTNPNRRSGSVTHNILAVHKHDDFFDFFRDRPREEHYAHILDSDSENEEECALAALDYLFNARRHSSGGQTPSTDDSQKSRRVSIETGSLAISEGISRRNSKIIEPVEVIENDIFDYFCDDSRNPVDIEISVNKSEWDDKNSSDVHDLQSNPEFLINSEDIHLAPPAKPKRTYVTNYDFNINCDRENYTSNNCHQETSMQPNSNEHFLTLNDKLTKLLEYDKNKGLPQEDIRTECNSVKSETIESLNSSCNIDQTMPSLANNSASDDTRVDVHVEIYNTNLKDWEDTIDSKKVLQIADEKSLFDPNLNPQTNISLFKYNAQDLYSSMMVKLGSNEDPFDYFLNDNEQNDDYNSDCNEMTQTGLNIYSNNVLSKNISSDMISNSESARLTTAHVAVIRSGDQSDEANITETNDSSEAAAITVKQFSDEMLCPDGVGPTTEPLAVVMSGDQTDRKNSTVSNDASEMLCPDGVRPTTEPMAVVMSGDQIDRKNNSVSNDSNEMLCPDGYRPSTEPMVVVKLGDQRDRKNSTVSHYSSETPSSDGARPTTEPMPSFMWDDQSDRKSITGTDDLNETAPTVGKQFSKEKLIFSMKALVEPLYNNSSSKSLKISRSFEILSEPVDSSENIPHTLDVKYNAKNLLENSSLEAVLSKSLDSNLNFIENNHSNLLKFIDKKPEPQSHRLVSATLLTPDSNMDPIVVELPTRSHARISHYSLSVSDITSLYYIDKVNPSPGKPAILLQTWHQRQYPNGLKLTRSASSITELSSVFCKPCKNSFNSKFRKGRYYIVLIWMFFHTFA